MKKIIKLILIISIIMISNFAILANTVQAVESGKITVYATGTLNRILKYNGILIKTTHAVYEENGIIYPVYCLNKDLPGVGDGMQSYQTTSQEKITDTKLWRIIINGYPYKSLEELGVNSYEEAYIATKQSVYCYLYNRGTENYQGVGEAGERTLNAMNTILENAKNSTENINEPNVEIIQEEVWAEDIYEKQYISKKYKINSNISIKKYFIQLENELEGTKITDIKNQEKNEFESNEEFKILIPIKNLDKSGKFKINIKTQIESKPVFYGKAPSSELQDYALTAFSFEDIESQLLQEYEKNNTQVIIKKQDTQTKENLQGAKFEILNEQQEIIRVVETDQNGQTILTQFLPGTYYIREIEAPDGYEIDVELKKIDIRLNEKIELNFENSKIEIVQEQVEEIPKLPVTGM